MDVSLVLALHREGSLLRRSLLSLQAAALHARADGISTELVVTLDRPDEATKAALREFDVKHFDNFRAIEVNHGSLGLARNSGINAAEGHYVTTCDGDDLISYNMVSALMKTAKKAGAGHIVFPQYICAFGERCHNWKYFPIDVVSPLSFIDTHPYISRAFGELSIFQSIPYPDAGAKTGYAFEDWHFNAECIARGHELIIADDTILFYRQRTRGLLNNSKQTSTQQIPPCSLFQPDVWIRTTQRDYVRLKTSGCVGLGRPDGKNWGSTFCDSLHQSAFSAANAIEPAINIAVQQNAEFGSNICGAPLEVGAAYHEVCQIVAGQVFDEVFLLPFITTGGAEKYINDVLRHFYEVRPTSRCLVVLGERAKESSYIDRVPPNVTVIDLGGDWPHLSMEQRELITLKLIQTTASRARLHMRQCPFAEGFFSKYKKLVRDNFAVFYRFCDEFLPDRTGGGVYLVGSFGFVSESIAELDLLVTDNQMVIEQDWSRIGVYRDKWCCLPARQDMSVSKQNIDDGGRTTTYRVLWASRLDAQKRPHLLPLIASELNSVAPRISIDVYGKEVLGGFDRRAFEDCSNIYLRGAYDNFCDLDHASYDAFIYTSAFDGMPNIILEAMSVGLPIIAPDIGGISEMVAHEETGLLLPSATSELQLVGAYVAAIRRLCSNPALRFWLATNARRRLEERHSSAAYAVRASQIFDIPYWAPLNGDTTPPSTGLDHVR